MKRAVMLIAAVAVLSGCEATMRITPDYDTGGPARAYMAQPTLPKIIPGQPAQVWGFPGLVEAWQSTGLFSSVTAAPSNVPTPNGVFVKTECDSDGEYNGATPILGMITLGLFPGERLDTDTRCSTSFYQQGQLLVSDSASWSGATIGMGWVVPVMMMNNEENERLNQADMSSLVVNHALAELSKRNP